MIKFDIRKSSATFGAAALILFGSACATKKHVRQVVGPVEARVTGAEQTNRQQQAAIGELNNSVARADERAQEADQKAVSAGQRADQAGQRADQANEAAKVAHNRANEGYSLAEATRSRLGELSENIDNYKQVTTESVLFGIGKYQLTKEGMQQLDNAVAQLQNTKNYILEVQGFTDSTGSAAQNLELSRRRADSVVRYLTSKHNVPLRRISMLGLGEDDPNADNKTREGRKQARRVEIRVFSRDLGGSSQNASTTNSSNDQNAPTNGQRTTGSANRTDDSSMPRLTQQGQSGNSNSNGGTNPQR
jgi:outer membrane protein OmpA-like peptidoglycan-associated protein